MTDWIVTKDHEYVQPELPTAEAAEERGKLAAQAGMPECLNPFRGTVRAEDWLRGHKGFGLSKVPE